MTHRRVSIRRAVRDGFAGSTRFADLAEITLWQAKVDAETLPVYGISTPTETKDHDAQSSAERVITVLVAIKRRGLDDLEDTLDDDSDHVERLVLTALATLGVEAELERTNVTIDGSADRRIGTLSMSFRAFTQTLEPI